jgi:hypothetical protein
MKPLNEYANMKPAKMYANFDLDPLYIQINNAIDAISKTIPSVRLEKPGPIFDEDFILKY